MKILERIQSAWSALWGGVGESDYGGLYSQPQESVTERRRGMDVSGQTDAPLTSSILIAAAAIRSGEMARARIHVVDAAGEPVDANPAARFFADSDQHMLIESTAHDYYIRGRAYWLVGYGDYTPDLGGMRRIESIRRLTPSQVVKTPALIGGAGASASATYRYYGQELDPGELVVFERYDGTSALSRQRLGQYLTIEANVLRGRARDSRLRKPRWAMMAASYNDGSAEERAMDAMNLSAMLSDNADMPRVYPLGENDKLIPITYPHDDELTQVIEVTIQAVGRDSGVPAVFLQSHESMTRWNSVRDARRSLWESHLMRELRYFESVLTAFFVESPLRVAFDTSQIEVLGDAREVNARTALTLATAAERIKAGGFMDDNQIREWFIENLPK